MPVNGPITNGKDFYFFYYAPVAESAFPTNPQIVINFRGMQNMILSIEGTNGNQISYSFNGLVVHGNLTVGQQSAKIDLPNHPAKKIWLRSASGATIRCEAWRS